MANHLEGRVLGKEELKQFSVAWIQSGEFWKKELAEEVLTRQPDIEHGEVSYCVEVMNIVALHLQQSSGS